MTAGEIKGVAVDIKGPRAAESALKPKALNKFPWLKVLIHNLAHNSSHNSAHNPAHNPARNPAKGDYGHVAIIVWQ